MLPGVEIATITDEYGHLPRFSDGRINYTHSDSAPVVACLVEYSKQVLIAKRSETVASHRNRWDVITGYIDDPSKSELEHAIAELEEELGINKEDIKEVKFGKRLTYSDPFANKKLMVFSVLIRVRSKPNIKLNHENIDFAWINPIDMEKYNVPELALMVRDLFN